MTRRRILLAELTPSIPGERVPAVWSGTDKTWNIVVSNGGRTATGADIRYPDGSVDGVRSNVGVSAGVYYWETTATWSGSGDFAVGIVIREHGLQWPVGTDSGGLGQYGQGVGINKSGTAQGPSSAALGAVPSGTVLRHWLDVDAREYRVAKAGGPWVVVLSGGGVEDWLWELSGHMPAPVATVHAVAQMIGSGTVSSPGVASGVTANFGQAPFVYDVPDGAAAGLLGMQPDSPVTVYLGSEALRTGPGESPANTYYEPRLAADRDVEIEREGSCWVWGNQSVSRRGQLVVVNADGGLDGWANLNWRDAAVALLAGWEGDARADFEPWGFARVDQIEYADGSRIILQLADPVAWLDRPLQTELYPADQPNQQIAGHPVPLVFGEPLYCPVLRLDPAPAARTYQAAENIESVDAVFDSGDRFAGPDDPYTQHNPVTGANGGNFTGWAGSPAMPTGWTRLTGFGPNDKFVQATGGGLRCISQHQPLTGIAHGVALQADRRYRISFQVAAVVTPGVLVFHAGGREVPFAFTPGLSGTHSVLLDTREAGPLQLLMRGAALDASIRALRVESERIIDWTPWPNVAPLRGFTLANAPAGKIVANLIGFRDDLYGVLSWINVRLQVPSLASGVPGFNMGSVTAVEGSAPYWLARWIGEPVTALTVAREAMDSYCGWITSNRRGQVVVGNVREPSRSAELELNSTNILGEIRVETDRARNLTLRLAGGRNHAPHRDNEIATGVPEDLRAELMAEWTMTAEGADELGIGAVSAAYVQAVGAPALGTWINRREHLRAEANRIATLWRPERRFYYVTALLDASAADALEPGQTVRLVWPRWGLHEGRHLLVVGVRSRFFARRVDLKLWG